MTFPREAINALPPTLAEPLGAMAPPILERLAPRIEDAAKVFTYAHDTLA